MECSVLITVRPTTGCAGASSREVYAYELIDMEISDHVWASISTILVCHSAGPITHKVIAMVSTADMHSQTEMWGVMISVEVSPGVAESYRCYSRGISTILFCTHHLTLCALKWWGAVSSSLWDQPQGVQVLLVERYMHMKSLTWKFQIMCELPYRPQSSAFQQLPSLTKW